jgi:hypothetical protein
MQQVKLKFEAKYLDHNVKGQNRSVTVQFKMPYSELSQYVQTLQLLNENITVAGKIGADKKPVNFGVFSLNNLNIDRDGEGKVKFNSLLDSIKANELNNLAARNDEPLILFLKADVDTEDEVKEEE